MVPRGSNVLSQRPIPHEELDPVWDGVFSSNENVLWHGRPDHGRGFWELEGQEAVYYWSLLVAGITIWTTGILVGHHSIDTAIFRFSFLFFVTVGGLAFCYYMASSRAYVMGNLFYAITDQRAVICRRGRNFRLADRRYVMYFPYIKNYAFPLHKGRKFYSVQVGSLLSEDTAQPFGFGLTHPGWPVGRAVGILPALFESVEDSEGLQLHLQKLTDALHS